MLISNAETNLFSLRKYGQKKRSKFVRWMTDVSNKQLHLEMIQGIINRLAHCSFLLKGWSVVIISALFALAANNNRFEFAIITYLPAIVFWYLDGYFLQQERLYRKLYDLVREIDEKEITFSMNTSPVSKEVNSIWVVMFSRTLIVFHGILIVTIILVTAATLFSMK